MKTALLLACILLAHAASASGEIIGVEQFDYTDGTIANQSGGTFWDYRNRVPAGHTGGISDWDNVTGAPVVTNARLVTNNTSAKREHNGPGEGNGNIDTDEGYGAINNFSNASVSFQNHVVYYRALVTTGATVPSTVTVAAMDFNTERVTFGVTGFFANDLRFSIWDKATGAAFSTDSAAPNTTYLLVAKLDYVAGKASLYVNPDLNAAENTQTPVCITDFSTQFWTTAVKIGSGSGGSAVGWDNLVVATTWDDLGTIVTTTEDEDDFSLLPTANGGPGVSLREAVKYSPSGTLITFDAALNNKTITLNGGDMQQGSDILTVDASSLAAGLTVDGNGASRLFFVGAGQTLTLRSLTLTGGNGVGNVFSGSGGAVDNEGILTLADCTLADNTSPNGGAIYSQGSNLTLTRCTFTDNSTSPGSVDGGAILLASGTSTVTRCTISSNTNNGSRGGGGIYLQKPVTLILKDTIVAGNVDASGHAADIYNFDGATVIAVGANLIGQNTTVESTFPAGSLAGTAAAPLNPKLAPLGYYGGPTETMHPLVGSPAIDTGGTTNPGTTDQRGFSGFVDGDNSGTAQLDIGAVEAGLLRTVTSIVDGQPGNLREVINNATLPGTHIVFAPGFSDFGFLLLNGELVIFNRTLFIDASNQPAPVKISGQNNSAVFDIPFGGTLAMQNLAIVNGRPAAGVSGGGIGSGGTVTLNQCTLSNNSVVGDGVGGAIFSNDPSARVVINQSTLSNNSSDTFPGGAIYNLHGRVTLNQSTVAMNSSAHDDGGGIYNNNGTLSLNQSTVSDNFGPEFGNGIVNLDGTLNLRNSIVANNTNGNVAGPVNSIGANITSGDPLLAPLGDYGGPTQTMALKPGSPARDAANGSTIMADQRGFPIVGAPDIGAYEAGTLNINFNAFIWETLPAAATEAQHNASADYDGDGQSNYNEWLAGTDVTNATSVFRMSNITRSGNSAMLTFTSVAGRTYVVQSSTDLVTWTDTDITRAGTGDPITVPFDVTGFTKLFFRARLDP